MAAPSGKTSNGLPYPLETDGVDPPRDIKALAEFLNTFEPPGTLPIGSEAEWAGQNDPNTKWMVEDGRELSRATYATLFAAIGTTYGIGDGSTTFNIPDTRGRASIGAGKGSGLTNRLRGEKVGEETHKLVAKESGVDEHYHNFNGNSVMVNAVPVAPAGGSGGLNTGNITTTGEVIDIQNGSAVGPFDAKQAHNNMQPSIVKNKIIRVL